MPVWFFQNIDKKKGVIKLMTSLLDRNLVNNFEKKININFKDKKLLQKALIHKSFSNEIKDLNYSNNERLEFLGDSVLNITISTYIFKNFPDCPEGELAKIRSVIVSETILARKALKLKLGEFLILGKGEEATGGRERSSILADTMEAIIGAIYLDQGFENAFSFVINLFNDTIKEVKNGNYIQDFKTIIQEIIQQKYDVGPVYQLVNSTGPDHNKKFEVSVSYNNTVLGCGTGFSKKEAEQNAAKNALKKLGKI